MLRLLLVRLAGAVLVLLLVSAISFGLMRLIPGDPSAAIAGLAATPAMVAQIREQLGLDQPVLTQAVHWYGGLLHGDLGRSILLGQSVFWATMGAVAGDDGVVGVCAGDHVGGGDRGRGCWRRCGRIRGWTRWR